MLFAIFPDHTGRYHLTTESGRTTLCGFPTGESRLFDAVRYPLAQLTRERPDGSGLILCPRCEAVEEAVGKPGWGYRHATGIPRSRLGTGGLN